MIRTFEAALRDIAEYGRRNPGYGFSCARMAQQVLDEAKAAAFAEGCAHSVATIAKAIERGDHLAPKE